MRCLGGAILVLVAVMPFGARAASAAKPDTVALSFGWTAGLRASVTTTRTRTRVTDVTTQRSSTYRYGLQVDADGGELRVRFVDPKLEPGEGPNGLPAAHAQIFEQAADLIPDLVVSKTGEFKGIRDVPAFQSRVRDFLAKVMPQGMDTAVVTRTLALATSEAFLQSKAAEQWNAIVGSWAGAALEPGELYAYSNKEPIALFPGQEVLMNYTFEVKRLPSCRRGGARRPCVELEMISAADTADIKRMLQFVFEKFSTTPPPMSLFETFEADNLVRLVTEPEGLIPHRLTITRRIQGTVREAGKLVHVEQVDQTQAEYTYP